MAAETMFGSSINCSWRAAFHSAAAPSLVLLLAVDALYRAASGGETRMDLRGDPLPEGAVARLGTVRWRTAATDHFLAFSTDGKQALLVSADDTLAHWDTATGQKDREFAGHKEQVYSAAISPDGKLALSGSMDKTLALWEEETGRRMKEFKGHQGNVRAGCFRADGKYALSGSEDATALVWKVE